MSIGESTGVAGSYNSVACCIFFFIFEHWAKTHSLLKHSFNVWFFTLGRKKYLQSEMSHDEKGKQGNLNGFLLIFYYHCSILGLQYFTLQWQMKRGARFVRIAWPLHSVVWCLLPPPDFHSSFHTWRNPAFSESTLKSAHWHFHPHVFSQGFNVIYAVLVKSEFLFHKALKALAKDPCTPAMRAHVDVQTKGSNFKFKLYLASYKTEQCLHNFKKINRILQDFHPQKTY